MLYNLSNRNCIDKIFFLWIFISIAVIDEDINDMCQNCISTCAEDNDIYDTY